MDRQDMGRQENITEHFLPQRRYDIDAVRVMAFALLILYHVGMFYVQDWGWHIKSQHQWQWLQQPMMFLNQWRMALLFTLSGMATAILIHKAKPGELRYKLKQRVGDLGWPLLFGIFVVVVPQAYFEALGNGAYSGSYWGFWFNYVTFGEWPEDAFGGSDGGFTWNHLWYLPYIIFYTLVTVLIRAAVKRLLPSYTAEVRSKALWPWYLVMMTVLLFAGLVIYPQFPYRSHALTDDWYTHSLFFCFFALGYFLIRSRGIWATLQARKGRLLVLGIVAYVGYRLISDHYPSPEDMTHHPLLWQWSQLVFLYCNRLTWILVVLGFAYQYLNRDTPWLQYANKAVFSWYILHQSLTVVIGGLLTPFALNGGLEFTLVLGGTLLGCLLIHHYIVRPVPLLHRFLGYSPRRHQLAEKVAGGSQQSAAMKSI